MRSVDDMRGTDRGFLKMTEIDKFQAQGEHVTEVRNRTGIILEIASHEQFTSSVWTGILVLWILRDIIGLRYRLDSRTHTTLRRSLASELYASHNAWHRPLAQSHRS